jgi:predicted nucleotidyltransferase
MPSKSLISVRKRSRTRDDVISALKEAVRKNIKKFPEVKRVLLFGSSARKDWGLRSDADILIILKTSEHKRFFDRIPRYFDLFLKVPLPIDIFPYTEDELKRMKKQGNPLILRALKEAIVLG